MFADLLYHLKWYYHLVKTGWLQALPAAAKAHFPAKKLKVIAITGTDGKTTSSTLLYQVLRQAGKKVALLSTVAAYIGSEEIDTGFHVTTPDPALLQTLFGRMVEQGCEYVVLEATSHGVYQSRLWGIQPSIVGVTNITHEHLDYHRHFRWYVAAKAMLLSAAPQAIINADDEQSSTALKRALRQAKTHLLTYSAQDRLPKGVTAALTTRFPEAYNQMNARLVYALAKHFGVSDQAFAKAVQSFPGIPGRMQFVGNQRLRRVIVDFAHTPNGVKNVLTAVRRQVPKPRKLIVVLGCAGLRDVRKRPQMGRFAAELADWAVFTAEDPRTEDVWAIIHQMKGRLGHYHRRVLSIPDRRQAIMNAITHIAKKGDTVVLLGKGHEKSLCYGTMEYPWSDAAVAEEALALLQK